MDERVLHLEDGTTIEAKVNFGTLYYMDQIRLFPLMKKADALKKAGKELSDHDSIQLAAKMIYVLLRSNGRNCDQDEALVLVPLDVGPGSEFEAVFQDFSEKIEKMEKKRTAREAQRQFLKNSQ